MSTVLKVMDEFSEKFEEQCGLGMGDELREAKVTVAELIEAGREWLALHNEGLQSRESAERVWRSGAVPRCVNRLSAAIVRCNGGAK